MKTDSNKLGIILVVLSGVFGGIVSIFIKALNSTGLNSLHIMFARSVITALLLAIFFLIKDRSLFKINPRDIWMFFGTGIVSMLFFNYCYFSAIIYSGAAVAIVLLYTAPAFVLILGAIIFKEKITAKKVVSLLLCLSGSVLTAGLIGSDQSIGMKALLLGLGSGFGYALYTIFAAIAVKKYSSMTIMFYTFVFVAAALFFIIDRDEFADLMMGAGMKGWFVIIAMSLVCSIGGYVFYTEGIKRMDVSKASILVTVEPIVGTLLGILAYHEDASFLKILGIVLILSAVILQSKE